MSRSSKPTTPRSVPPSPLAGASLASLPVEGLKSLAHLRHRLDLVVRVDGEEAWVSWEPVEGRDEVVEALLPVAGSAFYRRERGHWVFVGRHLPDFGAEAPAEEAGGLPLHRVLIPEPIGWEPPSLDVRPARLRLVRDDRPRPTSALRTTAKALLGWADRAPTASLEAVRAAVSGDRILLVGRKLPPILGADRYWGRRALVPLGFRTDPELPEPSLVEALGLGPTEEQLALIGPEAHVEVVPAEALRPLSRASARWIAGLKDRVVERSRSR